MGEYREGLYCVWSRNDVVRTAQVDDVPVVTLGPTNESGRVKVRVLEFPKSSKTPGSEVWVRERALRVSGTVARLNAKS